MAENAHSAEGDKPSSQPHHTRRWWWIPILLLIVAAVVYWPRITALGKSPAETSKNESSKSGKGGRGGDASGVTPVIAARVRKGDIGVYYTGLGAVTPIYTVTVKSRVDGELMNVVYKEGDTIHKDDLLIQIDPRPFQVQLTQAEGQLAKDQAALDNARTDLVRYQTLLKQNAIPEQQVATQIATVEQDEGVIKSDQGQIDSAKLNLTYCRITAPITGRMGLRLVDPGNIVHASDSTGLVVITQMQPISVLFTIAEDQLQVVLQKMHAGQKLEADAYDRDMQKKISQGTLTTVDNQIDQTTGTIRLRATFDNAMETLFPNEFVNIRLLVEQKRGIVLISSAAIQRTSNSTYVYLVQPDSTVTVRNITIGTTEGDNSEITSGLQAGDVVVMTGVDRLQEGSKVSVQIPGENQPSQK
jgi:membrane fusion protein, multidrug efflux system